MSHEPRHCATCGAPMLCDYEQDANGRRWATWLCERGHEETEAAEKVSDDKTTAPHHWPPEDW